MATFLLEAVYAPQKVSWLKPLPEGRSVSIGRLGLDHPDPSQPAANHADWMIPGIEDKYVSGRHFRVEIRDGRLHAEIFKDKPRPKFRTRDGERDELAIAPGEQFAVSQHVFRFRIEEASLPLYQNSLPAVELEKTEFRKAGHFLPAIEKLASLEMADEKYLVKFLKVLGPALETYKGRVAVVELHEGEADASKVVVDIWAPIPERKRLTPSRTVMNEARNAPRNAPRARFAANISGSLAGHCEWAACVSIPQLEKETRWGVYADGFLPEGTRDETFERDDLEDIAKLVSVAARLLGNYRHSQFYRDLANGLRDFLPAKLRTLVESRRELDTFRAAPMPITCLIGDVRGSCIIDSCAVQTLHTAQKQIEQVLADITGAIADTGGIVGGLQGDAAMGFWGWPRSADDRHSIERAVNALARIRRTYDDKNHPLWGAGQPGHGVHFGLGLAFGDALAGIMGVKEFRRIDLFGPVVNLAARLESLTKTLGVPIAVNEAVAEYVSNEMASSSNPPEVILMGRYRLAGMDKPLKVYELLPEGLSPKVASRSVVKDWEGMLVEVFETGCWEAAREPLEDLCDQTHFGKLAAVLKAKLDEARWQPPKSWRGFFDVDKSGRLLLPEE